MPKKTNAFQRVVLHLKTVLADGAKVEESAMVAERNSGALREVDILVTCHMAGHKVCIAFECAARGRPVDVNWVEGLCAKHESLPTDKLVLVSASGATKQAHIKAREKGAELMLVEDAKSWAPSAVQKLTQIVASRVELNVKRCELSVWVPDVGECQVSGFPDLRVFDDTSKAVGHLSGMVIDLLHNHTGLTQTLLQMGHKHPTAQYFTVTSRPTAAPTSTLLASWPVPGGANAPSTPINRYLHYDDTNTLHRIVNFRVIGDYRYAEAPADMRFGMLDGFRVAWGETLFENERLLLTYVDK